MAGLLGCPVPAAWLKGGNTSQQSGLEKSPFMYFWTCVSQLWECRKKFKSFKLWATENCWETTKQCDYSKSWERKNNASASQWAISHRTSLISDAAAAASTKGHKEIVLLTDVPFKSWDQTASKWCQAALTPAPCSLILCNSMKWII